MWCKGPSGEGSHEWIFGLWEVGRVYKVWTLVEDKCLIASSRCSLPLRLQYATFHGIHHLFSQSSLYPWGGHGFNKNNLNNVHIYIYDLSAWWCFFRIDLLAISIYRLIWLLAVLWHWGWRNILLISLIDNQVDVLILPTNGALYSINRFAEDERIMFLLTTKFGNIPEPWHLCTTTSMLLSVIHWSCIFLFYSIYQDLGSCWWIQ